jgi:uncharacterized protein
LSSLQIVSVHPVVGAAGSCIRCTSAKFQTAGNPPRVVQGRTLEERRRHHHEAMRVPAGGDTFRWRVSVAHIDASGPFSAFAQYNRKMVLLQGAGIDLRFGDGVTKTLRKVGELVEFDGAVAAQCELLNGPCVDLNLMVAKGDQVAVRVERCSERVAVSASAGETALIVPIDCSVKLEIQGEAAVTLEPWDLAVVSHGAGRLRRLKPDSAQSSVAAVFLAALKLVGGEQQAGFGV